MFSRPTVNLIGAKRKCCTRLENSHILISITHSTLLRRSRCSNPSLHTQHFRFLPLHNAFNVALPWHRRGRTEQYRGRPGRCAYIRLYHYHCSPLQNVIFCLCTHKGFLPLLAGTKVKRLFCNRTNYTTREFIIKDNLKIALVIFCSDPNVT